MLDGIHRIHRGTLAVLHQLIHDRYIDFTKKRKIKQFDFYVKYYFIDSSNYMMEPGSLEVNVTKRLE